MSKLQLDDASVSSVDSFDESENGSNVGEHGGNEMDTTQKEQVKEVQDMAKIETRNMRAWKIVVCLAILATATLVSTGTFIFLKDDEDSSYKESYYSFANTIANAVQVHTHNLFSTMRHCSNSISGAAIATNSEFPFVTVPTFEILGESVRQQSGAEALIFNPKVEASDLARWQEYATANQGWYEESKRLDVSSGDGSLVASDYGPARFVPFVYDRTLDEDGKPKVVPAANPPFFPIWQFSPPPFTPDPIKANIASRPDYAAALKAVEIVREGVLGETATDPNPLASAALKTEEHEAFHDAFVTSNTESAFARPHGKFIQPIFREIYNDTSEIVGTVQAMIAWDRYFANLLPDGVKGITCVLKNTCGGSFTYHLDGISVSCSPRENKWCLMFSIAANSLI
jgi:hypothetical protein